ncbi:LysR family transcriptional regulator [Bryobacter aggregatus]|uniref:LysR family transcriptional regulator n=1 Tax=Bryobacter aggregatus TaxID=360054 RepID=UPI0009B5BA55|nr:LysR family transcriptional regulator [Bryobacter aggregatus]
MLPVVQLEHMRLFRDIAHSRSVSRGAQLNKVSQSAASQHLQELERVFGIVLLDRSTRPIRVTPAGQAYLEFCREVLRRKVEFEAEIDELKRSTSGEVRVASIYSVGLSKMNRLEQEFRERYKDSQLRVEYLRPEKVYEAVREERADIGLVSYPLSNREVKALPWRNEQMVLAMSNGHVLANMKRVTPARLDAMAFVAFDRDLPIRKDIDTYLKENGAEVDVVMNFDNMQMVKEAVELGSGVSIVPRAMIEKELDEGRVKAAELSPSLIRPLGIIHRRNSKMSRAVKAFLDLLQEHAELK